MKLVDGELGNYLNEVQTDNIIIWQIQFKTPPTQVLTFPLVLTGVHVHM